MAASLSEPTVVPESELKEIVRRLRRDILIMLAKAGSGHPGGSLSAVDLVLALYSGEMRYDAKEPQAERRDRFVLSKGHGVPALYAVMAEKGFFDHDQLTTLRELGSPLQGHPANALLPGIEASTGSLGQGLSVAQGIGMAAKLKGQQDGSGEDAWRVYCICGDGEIQEGQVWEVALSAPHHKLGNLTAIVDWNKAQIDGTIDDVLPLGAIKEKWAQFGWHVQQVDGHDFTQIRSALKAARDDDRPSMIVADTIKGKGVSFMESNIVGWHGKTPNDDELKTALAELEGAAPGGAS